MKLCPSKPKAALILPCLAVVLVLSWQSSASASFILDFSTNSSLPSAQGLTYEGSSGVAESSAYSVSGGELHLNTIQFSSDVYAYYDLPGGYNSSLDADMKMTINVSQITGGSGVLFGFYDTGASYDLVSVTKTGWSILGGSGTGSFSDQSAFHVLDLKTSAANNSYAFYVDGTEVASGTRIAETGSGPRSTDVYFGDGTPTGGNVIAAISSVGYTNTDQVQSTPEPSGIVLASLAGLTLTAQLGAGGGGGGSD